jgi:hypothetical protein
MKLHLRPTSIKRYLPLNIDKLSEDLSPPQQKGREELDTTKCKCRQQYIQYAILRIWELSGEEDILPLFLY